MQRIWAAHGLKPHRLRSGRIPETSRLIRRVFLDELRATFDNKDLSFLPGQLINVTVQLDKIANALVVPHDAVNEGPAGTFVYVVENGRARQVPVNVRFDDAKNVAIEGNVKPGDKVIAEGQLRVDPGGAVNVLGAPPPVSVDLGLPGLQGGDQPNGTSGGEPR